MATDAWPILVTFHLTNTLDTNVNPLAHLAATPHVEARVRASSINVGA